MTLRTPVFNFNNSIEDRNPHPLLVFSFRSMDNRLGKGVEVRQIPWLEYTCKLCI